MKFFSVAVLACVASAINTNDKASQAAKAEALIKAATDPAKKTTKTVKKATSTAKKVAVAKAAHKKAAKV
jgi:hypothetical protein